jgi:hypothetical protein
LAAGVLLAAALTLAPTDSLAASCCGGGSGASIVLPKFSELMLDLSTDLEFYDGFWDRTGAHVADPPGSDLAQYRINLGVAYRFSDNWQGSLVLPYAINDNRYAGVTSHTQGIGDLSASVWYEFFDTIQCVWDVNTWEDLVPAIYLGGTLTIPTGASPYDTVANSFDVTGRGFYRYDMTLLMDKTVYPWNLTFTATYGVHAERPVNREFGVAVEPYEKKLGDRRSVSLAGGYTHFLASLDTLTATLALAELRENTGSVNGAADPSTGLSKRSAAFTVGWASFDKAWVAAATYNRSFRQDGWGENFPTTDILTFKVSHVLR